LQEAQNNFKQMVPEVCRLFSDIEQLIRLMLICPVSSCTAERSFSSLRRTKNWLRTTMTQQRLNSIVICHVNKNIVDDLNIVEIAAEFGKRSAVRVVGLFGSYDSLKL
jgi:hypothetical protein